MSSQYSAKCECGKIFYKMSNLRTHIKRKHPDKLETLAPKKIYATVATCRECSKTFVKRSNLQRHVKEKHPDKYQKVGDKKPAQLLKCTLCESHNGELQFDLKNHYQKVHNVHLETEDFEFNSFEEFQTWKSKIERETYSYFVNMHGSQKTKNYTRTTYECHRSGNFRSIGKGRRHLKMQGSNKIGGYCPASIKLIVNDGLCKVQFFKTHVGHEHELGHLRLTSSERQELATKIASKVPFPMILDDIRDSVTNCRVERLHLLQKKDLYNIKQSYQLNSSSVRHANDSISVESLTVDLNTVKQEKQEESAALLQSISKPLQPEETELQAKKSLFIQEFLKTINKINSVEQLNVVKNITASIEPTLAAMKSQKDAVLVVPPKPVPHNKKITKQNFYSTSKKNMKKTKDLSKPSAQEVDTVAIQLLKTT